MQIIIKTLAGLEEILVSELKELGGKNIKILKRAVSCEGDQKFLYKCNLHLRTALRVLVHVSRFYARNEQQLYDGVKEVYWDKYITRGKTIAVNAVIQSDFFNHSHYVALKTKDAVVDQLRTRWGERPNVDTENPDIRIHTHIQGNKVSISLDSSGQSLHMRGYRVANVIAPLNEVLAAGLVLLSGWDQKTTFVDPMCGSGTLLIEAALFAMNKSPHSHDKIFSFINWKDYNQGLWNKVLKEARESEKELEVNIAGFDESTRSINASKYNIAEAGLGGKIKLEKLDFFRNTKIEKGAFLIMNPPYDMRLKNEDIIGFFKSIGDHMKKNLPGSTIWIISSNITALKLLGLKPSRRFSLFNGPNPAKFHKFELYEGSRKNN